jgi:hypothetical protein
MAGARVERMELERGMRRLLGACVGTRLRERERVHGEQRVIARIVPRPRRQRPRDAPAHARDVARHVVERVRDAERDRVARPAVEQAAEPRLRAFEVVVEHRREGSQMHPLALVGGQTQRTGDDRPRRGDAANVAGGGELPRRERVRHHEAGCRVPRCLEGRVVVAAPGLPGGERALVGVERGRGRAADLAAAQVGRDHADPRCARPFAGAMLRFMRNRLPGS